MTTIPIDADGAVRRSTVLARGIHPTVLYRAVEAGELQRISSGLYVPAGTKPPDVRHRLMLGAVATSPKEVLSHESAAVLYGLPMLRPDLREVHLTVPPAAERVHDEFRRCHTAALPPCDIVELRGHCVTSLERTAVDVARTSPMGFAGALAVFDAALRRGADAAGLTERVRRCGSARMSAAMRHASPLADGVGESWCRAQVLGAGLPRPRLKHALLEEGDEEMAQPDMDWGGLVLGEFDGAARYERVRVPGDTALSASWRAIARDDRLRERGIRVLRWTWSDLERHDVAASCRYRLQRAGLIR
jgi:hypothetical protein